MLNTYRYILPKNKRAQEETWPDKEKRGNQVVIVETAEQEKALVPHWTGLVQKLTTASFLYLYPGSTIVWLFWCIFTGNLIFAVINPCWLKRSDISTDILSQFVIFLLEMNCQHRWLQSTFLLQRVVKNFLNYVIPLQNPLSILLLLCHFLLQCISFFPKSSPVSFHWSPCTFTEELIQRVGKNPHRHCLGQGTVASKCILEQR